VGGSPPGVPIIATLVWYRPTAATPRLTAHGDQPIADTSKDQTMNFNSAKRPLLLGLALSVTGAAGAAAAVTLAVASPPTAQNTTVAPTRQSSPAVAAPPIAAAPASSVTPVTAAPAPTVINPGQARGIAERAGNGQADNVQTETGPTGIAYDVSVTRSDGTDVQFIIDGHTGRILTTIAEPQNPQDSTAPDSQNGTD
jgi:uncharacterized membrane protein YkoI